MRIIGAPVSNFSTHDRFVENVEKVLDEGGGYVCFANAHMLVEYTDSRFFARVMESAAIVCPDGRPLSILQRLLGVDSCQIRGEDATLLLCGKEGVKVGFIGSTQDVLANLKDRLQSINPTINVALAYSPPFRELSDEEINAIAVDVNELGVDYLFVGLGCPKQEIFMYRLAPKTQCVLFGVGAAFDFISGNKKTAPRLISRLGFEWLYRLLSEPKRLFARYFYTNSKFIYLVIRKHILRF